MTIKETVKADAKKVGDAVKAEVKKVEDVFKPKPSDILTTTPKPEPPPKKEVFKDGVCPGCKWPLGNQETPGEWPNLKHGDQVLAFHGMGCMNTFLKSHPAYAFRGDFS